MLRRPGTESILRILKLVSEANLLAMLEVPENTPSGAGTKEATLVIEEKVLLQPRLVLNTVHAELQSRPINVEVRNFVATEMAFVK